MQCIPFFDRISMPIMYYPEVEDDRRRCARVSACVRAPLCVRAFVWSCMRVLSSDILNFTKSHKKIDSTSSQLLEEKLFRSCAEAVAWQLGRLTDRLVARFLGRFSPSPL